MNSRFEVGPFLYVGGYFLGGLSKARDQVKSREEYSLAADGLLRPSRGGAARYS